MNYADQITAFLNGEKAISTIARALIESGQNLGKEMDSLEKDVQFLFDEEQITADKIKSINAGLQRETGRFSLETVGISVKVGIKLGEADTVTCYNVTAKRETTKDELLAAVSRFKAAIKNDKSSAECSELASKVTRLMIDVIPKAVKAA